MKPLDFLTKYNGQPVDYDLAYGDQCVDLYDQYCKEALNAPVILVNGAVNIWDNYPTDYFDKIPNTPDNCPQLGDVVIWGTGIGPFGHVAICRDGNQNSFTSLDQNWNGIQHCEYITHNYTAILGWLRPKTHTQTALSQTLPVSPTFTNQTKIPAALLGTTDDMEIQQIKGKLNDLATAQQLIKERDLTINDLSLKLQNSQAQHGSMEAVEAEKDTLDNPWDTGVTRLVQSLISFLKNKFR